MSMTNRLWAFDERRDHTVALTEDQVAFPVTGHRAVVGFGRPFANVQHRGDVTLTVPEPVAARPAGAVPQAQMARELFA
jgi:hypothetical protein